MKVSEIIKNTDGILIKTDQGNYGFYGIREDIMRAVYTKKEQVENQSLLIEPKVYQNSVRPDFADTESEIIIHTAKLKARWQKADGTCIWEDAQTGKVYAAETQKQLTQTDVIRYTTQGEKPVVKRVKTVDGERSFIENLKQVKDRVAYRAKLGFGWEEEEAIYGLGQGEEGIYNHRGQNQYLYQHNMRIPMPMFVSSKGYGILADCCSIMTFQDDINGSYLFMDTVDQLDYYFIAGRSMDGVIDGYRCLTGKAAMLPKWAFGYVQSKEAYHTDQEILEVAEEYRRRNIPVDCIVQDWNTWVPGLWGEKKLDPSRYSNMKEVNRKLHEMNIHTMVSVWPNMAEGGVNHREFVDAGYILGDYSTYDAFDENARKLYWKQASEELFSCGFDSWWCDSTEPFSGPDWSGEVKREPWERYDLVGKEHKKYLDATKTNAFALMHAKGIFENQREEKPDKRVLNLTRSGYASQQKYGVVLWSGDISATWEVLRQQVAEGLNMAMSGMPYWTLDIGGFFVVGSAWWNRGCNNSDNPNPLWFWKGEYNEGVADKGYCELYTRWFQFGTFLPMHRSHGTDTPREIWNFGEKGSEFYDAIEKFIRLRYRLMPYIYSLAGSVYLDNSTIMRSLMFDFAGDAKVKNRADEYMFGPNLLVCPVMKPVFYGAGSVLLEEDQKQKVYLPDGCIWYDLWTEKMWKGGQEIETDITMDKIPVYVRAGSILPLAQEDLQYAQQELQKPLAIKVYPGADGSFQLYEDAGDDYGYETGAYVRIKFTYCDRDKTLHISEQEGSCPGMKEQREFDIICGDMHTTVLYYGKEVNVSL